MSFELRYHMLLPKTEKQFTSDYLCFTINHIKSRVPSVLFFIFHCFNMQDEEIYLNNGEVAISDNVLSDNYTQISEEPQVAYVSPRKAIGTVFSEDGMDYTQLFEIPTVLREATAYTQLEIVTMGIGSENPLYFNELQLQEATSLDEEDNPFAKTGYHDPSELVRNHSVELPNGNYANLYTSEGDYLQVIRPNREAFSTLQLDKAQYTILAPHFADEKDIDNHVAVFLEAMNQTEQTIDVLR